MKKTLPTYQDCLEICKNKDYFYEKVLYINNTKVSVFNYHIADYQDFKNPIEGSEIEAFELRGLTFVHETSGIKRYLMLHKFFNLNQVQSYMLDQVKHKKVVQVQEKSDGSMIRFIKVNGQIVSKTKNGLDNDQSRMAQELLDNNPSLKDFVIASLDENLGAIFELVSPFNQVVLTYKETKLELLQIRDEETGEYLDLYNHPLVLKYKPEIVNLDKNLPIEEYVGKLNTTENMEGWIVTLEDGQKIKLKTKWYLERHHLVDNILRENLIIQMILDQKMDDVLGILPLEDQRRKYAERISEHIKTVIEKDVRESLSILKDYDGNRKEFAIKNRKHPLFHVLMGSFKDLNNKEEVVFKLVTEHYKDEAKTLTGARDFLKNTGFKLEKLNLESE